MKRVLNGCGIALIVAAVLVALAGLWLNVILDGLDTNTCTAVALTVCIVGLGGGVLVGLANDMPSDADQ